MIAVRSHMRLPVRLSAGMVQSRFCDEIRSGRIAGNRCPSCRAVYVPPRPFCARCWTSCEDWIVLPDTGVVETFVVVNVPFYGQQVEIPYILAHIRLDGADAPFLHLVGGAGDDGRLTLPSHVASGMRVRAVWRPARTGFFSEDVDHFEPLP